MRILEVKGKNKSPNPNLTISQTPSVGLYSIFQIVRNTEVETHRLKKFNFQPHHFVMGGGNRGYLEGIWDTASYHQ